MSTMVKKIVDLLLGRPSAARGMLWSFGLHATALAATCTWWSNPIAPTSFAGSRYVVQLEASFSELPTTQEIETVLELEATPPQVELSPTKLASLPRFERERKARPLAWEEMTQSVEVVRSHAERGNEVEERESEVDHEFALETNPLSSIRPRRKPPEIKPVEPPKNPPPQPLRPPMRQATAVVEQFAGVDDRTPPDLSGNRPPRYPAEAIRRHLEGVVLLRLRIAASGQVERVEIAKSSGYSILDHTAVEAVTTWHARPAEQEGKAVATVEILPVRFRL